MSSTATGPQRHAPACPRARTRAQLRAQGRQPQTTAPLAQHGHSPTHTATHAAQTLRAGAACLQYPRLEPCGPHRCTSPVALSNTCAFESSGDFIVNDDGQGYADLGEEDDHWRSAAGDGSDNDSDDGRGSKRRKNDKGV